MMYHIGIMKAVHREPTSTVVSITIHFFSIVSSLQESMGFVEEKTKKIKQQLEQLQRIMMVSQGLDKVGDTPCPHYFKTTSKLDCALNCHLVYLMVNHCRKALYECKLSLHVHCTCSGAKQWLH